MQDVLHALCTKVYFRKRLFANTSFYSVSCYHDSCSPHFSHFVYFRTEFAQRTEFLDSFFVKMKKDLVELLQHDFVTNSQSDYFKATKDNSTEGEFLVSLDFSENYTFLIQDAIQAHHWSNTQATIHPYVIYIRKKW